MVRELLHKTAHIVLFALILLVSQGVLAQEDHSPGQRIVIDGEEYFLHVVDKGQGFYSIARQYNVSQQEILEANPEIKTGLEASQVIRIPVIEGRNTSVDEIKESDDFILHTVEKGQTAWYISQKYDVDLEEIYKHNPGAEEQLTVGSMIKVPSDQIKGEKQEVADQKDKRFRRHEVKAGDTLFSLSQRYNVTVDDIIEHNPALKTGSLQVGSIVRIPKSEETIAGKEEKSDTSKASFISGDEYDYHKIRDGQTLYSVSRKYQVDVEELKEANADIDPDDLEQGYMLRIPKGDEEKTAESAEPKDDELFESHRVRRRETLFSISREYNVDMETIREVNPDIEFSDLKKGTEIKIPKDEWFAQKYKRLSKPEEEDDGSITLRRDKQSFKTSTDSICDNPEGIGEDRPARVAILLPFALDDTDEANIREEVEDGDTTQVKREDRIISSRSRVFAEFYEGVLLALDKLKEQNIDVDLSVHDIASNSVKQVLESNPDLKNTDMIIGPARSDDLELVSDFARKHKIKTVYPLSNKNPELENNPYIFHVNTPDSLLFGRMTNKIVQESEGHNLLVVLPEEEEDYASGFLDNLRKKVFFSQFTLNRNISYREYRMIGREDQTNLEALLDSDKKNVVVAPTNEEATISKIVPTLAGISENQNIDISLFGMTEWLRSQSISPEDMFTLNARIFSLFALDYNNSTTQKFIQKYRDWYHTEPHAVSPYFQSSSNSSGYSRYGAWGYDVAGYFISTLARYGKDFEYCPESVDVEPVQFNFSFTRHSNWGGFYNEGLFLLKFIPEDYKVERVPVFSIHPIAQVGTRDLPNNFESDI
ncbi:MAG: LysM peptidoglycan-binding domain-containing protein [Bacteroidota bacterium]